MSNPAKEYLQQVYKIEKSIKVKSDSIKDIDCRLEKCTSTLTDMPHSADDPGRDKLNELTSKKIKLQEENQKAIKEMLDKRLEVVKTIDQLPDLTHRQVLELRYLQFKKWNFIWNYMNYTEQHLHRIHGRALKEVNKILGEE